MRYLSITLLILIFFLNPTFSFAQTKSSTNSGIATGSANTSSASATSENLPEKNSGTDFTKPEQSIEKEELIAFFSKRPLSGPTLLNIIGYSVQYAVKVGVPANTIILILLLPFLATIIVFCRQIIGIPTLEMLVPIALSITLVSTGLTAGLILLITILVASTLTRIFLKGVRIMQLPKMAMSMLFVSVFVFIALTVSASLGLLEVRRLSIFPILLLILLSDKIVALQLSRSPQETLVITLFTLSLGLLGFIILSFDLTRQVVLLYPEILLALIPINILIGRYFGLRLTELYKFSELQKYANK